MRNSHHRIADIFSLFILLILFALFLLISPIGLKLTASLVNSVGLGLEIKGVNGTLLKGITIESLSWRKKDTGIKLTNIKLDLHKVKYSKDVFNIKNLSASALNIYIPPSDPSKKDKTHVVIPDIPIPLNMLADHVKLDTLRVIRDRKDLLFKIDDMQVDNVSIIDNKLYAQHAKAKPEILGSPLITHVNGVALNFDKPHEMSGLATLQYSHFQLGSFSANAIVGGTLTDYKVEGTMDWEEQLIGKSEITLKGFGNYHGATFSSVLLEHSEGRLEGTGNIAWIDAFSWNAAIKGSDVHPNKFFPQWPALVDLQLDTQGRYGYKDKKWSIDMNLLSMKGKVNGFPLEASGLITFKESILRAKKLAVITDKNRIFLEGRITEPFQLDWDINAKKVGQFFPDYSGSIVGKGKARGTTIDPTGSGQLVIKNLKGDGVSVESADIDLQAGAHDNLLAGKGKVKIRNFLFDDYKVAFADIEFDGREKASLLEGKGSLRLKNLISKNIEVASAQFKFNGTDRFLDIDGVAEKIKVSKQTIDALKLNTKGTIKNHLIKLTGKSKKGDLLVEAKGGWLDSKWKGNIRKITLKHLETGNWLLNKPVQIKVASNDFSGSEICISNPKRGKLCTHTQWNSEKHFSSKGTLMNIPLKQIEPWLPDNLALPGLVSGAYDVKETAQGLVGVADFLLPDGMLIIKKKESKNEKLAYHGGKVNIKFRGKKVNTSIKLIVDGRGEFTSQSVITLGARMSKHRIKGEARFAVTNFNWAQEFFPDINNLKGKINSKITFQGLLTQPQYSGELLLKDARLSIPDTGTHLTNITLVIKTTQPNQATIKGSINTGNAKLLIDGGMKINKLNDWVADLNLKGKSLQFMNTHEVQAYASPDLRLKITPQLAQITGSFHIPKARINLSELPETAIYESDDIVFVKDQKVNTNGIEKKPLRIQPNVAITLGKDITFNGFGLKAKLSGKFHVRQNNNAIVSRGTLRIKDGYYSAYGQRLKIDHGVLVFHGPLHNPGLDIRATRSINGDDLKVGINLVGTLQKPKSSIFSDPPQPESDALSYLITGQSLSETSGDQAQLLVQAVRTLGINSGSTLLNRVGGSVGLDDLNIITYADYKKNKLQLGKKLGTNLYIRYITGLFDTFHQIAVDYKISSKWSLQAESGEAQGVDFIYNIDKN